VSEFFLRIGSNNNISDNTLEKNLKHFDDSIIYTFHKGHIYLVLSSCDAPDIWSPFVHEEEGIGVFIVGRIALPSNEWSVAGQQQGRGGLACKWIYSNYKKKGLKALEELNGAYTVFIMDESAHTVHLVTDRCGMYQCFHYRKSNHELVFSSNADILAKTCGVSGQLDITSVGEFLMTGKVSFPFTYYERIKSLSPGTIFTYLIDPNGTVSSSSHRYFDFSFEIDSRSDEWALAEELAEAIKNAVRKRTLPLFGKCGIFLSGGLDSRTLLCAADNKSNIVAFTFFDKENYEYRIARRIAEEVGVEFFPLKRDFEHYGNFAEQSIQLGCGMGDCFNNHFLGFRDILKQRGVGNIITGFYFDYFFKGLALDRAMVPYAGTKYRIEKEGEFKFEHYKPHFRFETEVSRHVEERLDESFPHDLRNPYTPDKRLIIMSRRLFPLCYEPDHAETVVSQKAFPWYLPIVDNDILRMYLRIHPNQRLNAALYTKAVKIVVGNKIASIPDTNTRSRVGATNIEKMISFYIMASKEKMRKYFGLRKQSIANEGSWPNLDYYIANSKVIREIWERPNDLAEELFSEIIGYKDYKLISNYSQRKLYLFLRLFTLKVWLDQLQSKS